MRAFQAPQHWLEQLDSSVISRVLATTADLALVLDDEGTILDVACAVDASFTADWVGRRWVDTVAPDSRRKIASLLEAADQPEPRWRQVNHPLPEGGPDVPVSYCALTLDQAGRRIAIGRDLRSTAAMQQQLVEVQQSLERDYWQLREAETRYRALFQMATEPVLVLDARSRRIQDANPAALEMLGGSRGRLVGQGFPRGFEASGQHRLERLLEAVATAGHGDPVEARHEASGVDFRVSASLLRQHGGPVLLVHLIPAPSQAPGGDRADPRLQLVQLMENAPDAVLVTDADGVILHANRAFLELAGLTHPDQARHQPLDRWLGRQSVDLEILLANLRRHDVIRLYPTTLRSAHGGSVKVEVSACTAPNGAQVAYGVFLRHVDTRLGGTAPELSDSDHPRSVEQMTELVGQVPLKELVRESTDLIERLCIEAALRLTGDNRASAAELLGLSRQSLYVKMRRYGLMGADPSQDEH